MVSRHVYLKNLSGQVILPPQFSRGLIMIGYGDVGIFDEKLSRSVWEVKGKVTFEGKAFLGHGSKICVAETGELSFGPVFKITAESSIICFKKVSFGSDCMLSWDILIMDTDFHKIKSGGQHLNADREVVVGNRVWIGARSCLLKGTVIPDRCVVGAGSLLNGKLIGEACLFAGSPAKKIKENIEWDH